MAKSKIGRAMSRMWGGISKKEKHGPPEQHGPKLPDRGVLQLTKEMMVKPGQKADWDESKHRRNKGKFASKGGPSKKSKSSSPRLGKGMRQINKEQGEGGGQRWKKVVS